MKTKAHILLLLPCFILLACDRDQSASTKATPMECRRDTEIGLDAELQHPSTIGGEQRDSKLIQEFYLPGLRRAKASLDKMERGKLQTVPVFCWGRSLGEGAYVLDITWLQNDNTTRTVTLLDKDGVVATCEVPLPGNIYTKGISYFRGEVVRVDTEPPYDGGKPTTEPGELVIRCERRLDPESLKWIIAEQKQETGEALPICLLGPPGAAATQESKEQLKRNLREILDSPRSETQ